MMGKVKYIDELFALARVEEPRVSSEMVLKKLQNSISQSKGGSLNNISTLKLIIMIGTISTMTLTALMLTTTPNEKPTEFQQIQSNQITSESLNEKPINQSNEMAVILETSDNEQYDEFENIKNQNTITKVDVSEFNTPNTPNNPTETFVFNGKKETQTKRFDPKLESVVTDDLKNSRIFIIDQNTGVNQLEMIKAEAEQAGISFDYKIRGNGSLKKLHMMITTESSTSSYKLVVDKDDKTQIGWIVDKENNTVRFYDRQNEIKLTMVKFAVDEDSILQKIIDFEKKVIMESSERLKR